MVPENGNGKQTLGVTTVRRDLNEIKFDFNQSHVMDV